MIQTIDCDYLFPQFAAAFLMVEGKKALFVENNTAHSVPLLMEALKRQGLSPEDVEYLIITHVHLDHAGGSGRLMKLCPNAKLLAHPRAAKHVIDPSRLEASARQVYGEEVFNNLYGELVSVDAARVREMGDGEILEFGRRKLRFFHTRGHANHHFCVFDSGSNGVFTGDSFGLAYPLLQKKGLFIFPSTSPTDFDPLEARASVRKIVETGAEKAYLTHFGEITDLKSAAEQLKDHLDFSEELLNESIQKEGSFEDLTAYCESRLRARFQKLLEKKGIASDKVVWNLLKLDLELNAAGIAHVAIKRKGQ